MKSKKSNHELTRIDSNLGSNVSNQLHQREEDIFPSIEFPLYEEKSERWASERRWWNRSVPRETCKFNYKRGRRSNGSSDFGGVSSDEGKKPEAKKSHRRINNHPSPLPLGKKLPQPRNDGSKYFTIVRIFSRLKREGKEIGR